MGNNCYIKFSFINGNIYQRIEKLFNYIKAIKNEYIQIGNLDDDIKLLEFFSEEELNYFWWPTEQENNEFWDTYEKLPAKKKAEHLNSVPWDYATVFDEIGQGEYEITNCRKINETTGILYFYPTAFPYGGTKPLQEAIKAFGAKIIDLDG